MANLWPGIKSDIEGMVETVWAVPFKSYSTMMAEINWKNLFSPQNGATPTLVPPVALIHIPQVPPSDRFGAASVTWTPRITLVYIQGSSRTGTLAAIDAVISAMEDYLLNTRFTHFKVRRWTVSPDASEENPVNLSFRRAAMPLTGGSISFELQFGKMALTGG